MNPWIMIGAVGIGIYYLIDYALRRKKWSMNTREEKNSLMLAFCCVPVYLFLAALGLFWGITGNTADTAIGQLLYEITLVTTGYIWIVAILMTILSLILRKLGKVKASFWVNVIGLAYCLLNFGVSILTDIL